MIEILLEIIAVLPKVIPSLAAVIGVIIAFKGLGIWRDQMQGKTEYDLARRILKNLYMFVSALQQMRNDPPVPDATKNAKETDSANLDVSEKPTFLNTQWNRVNEIGSELDTDLFEAKALWCDLLKQPKKNLLKCKAKLKTSMSRHARIENLSHEERDLTPEEEKDLKGLDAIVYRYGNDENPDDYDKSLSVVIEDFERALRPYVPQR